MILRVPAVIGLRTYGSRNISTCFVKEEEQSVPVFTAARVIDEDEQFKLRGMLKGSQSFLLYEESNIPDNIRRI